MTEDKLTVEGNTPVTGTAMTAMQELIANAMTAKEHSKDGMVSYDEVIEVATELLAKEREQIEDAYDEGVERNLSFESGKQYFTQTYSQP